MDGAIRTWIEKRDEKICRVCQDLQEDIALVIEALYWLSEIDWDRTKAPDLVQYLNEYGKPEALVVAMRHQWKEWKTTPEEAILRMSR